MTIYHEVPRELTELFIIVAEEVPGSGWGDLDVYSVYSWKTKMHTGYYVRHGMFEDLEDAKEYWDMKCIQQEHATKILRTVEGMLNDGNQTDS